MTLSYTQLRDAIVTELESRFGAMPEAGRVDAEKFAEAIAKAIVEHLQVNADINIEPADSGLQRDPITAGDCLGPTVTKTLKIT
jgi:hypothetical protein